MKFYSVEQGSATWYAARLGIPTASNCHKIVTPKGEPSKQASKLLYRLVAERLLRETMDDELGFVSWVARGKELEPQAVAQFEFINDVRLEPGGFVTSDDGRIGCSPDRLFPGHGQALEVKSPAPFTHLQYLLEGPGDDYVPQVQMQLLVGGFEVVHFLSYHPQMPPTHLAYVPDRAYRAKLVSALNAFCDVLDVMTERARALGAYAVAHRVETPADLAYGEGEVDLTIVDPERK